MKKKELIELLNRLGDDMGYVKKGKNRIELFPLEQCFRCGCDAYDGDETIKAPASLLDEYDAIEYKELPPVVDAEFCGPCRLIEDGEEDDESDWEAK